MKEGKGGNGRKEGRQRRNFEGRTKGMLKEGGCDEGMEDGRKEWTEEVGQEGRNASIKEGGTNRRTDAR
jgi:hypothetical protein